MNNSHLMFIFESFICFFSLENVRGFLAYCIDIGEVDIAEKYSNILRMSEQELRYMIRNYHGDHELLYINVFLWKHLTGQINSLPIIEFDTNRLEIYGWMAWIIHRFTVLHDRNLLRQYNDKIVQYLEFYRHKEQYNDDDYFSIYARYLNVIGLMIKCHPAYKKIIDFLEYIIHNIKSDPRLKWIRLSNFTLLAYDLSYPSIKTWPVFREVLTRNYDGVEDFLAYILAIRMYGNMAREELKDNENVKRLGGITLLDILATT